MNYLMLALRVLDGYPKDPDPEHWRTINGAKVHLDENGNYDGGAHGKFNGRHHWGGPDWKKKNSGVTSLTSALAALARKKKGKEGQGRVEPPKTVTKVTSVEEAKSALKSVVGFTEIENIERLDPNSAVTYTNQLIALERRFSAIHKGIAPHIKIENKGPSTNACVSSKYVAPNDFDLFLCPQAMKDEVEHAINKLYAKKTGWCMPFDDKNAKIYTVTHEYGHIIQNGLIQKAYEEAGLDPNNPNEYVDIMARTAKGYFKWYNKISDKVQKQCLEEIYAIAQREGYMQKFRTKRDTAAEASKYISRYGRTNKAESFAEIFANSQLGEPNALGKAMQIWLKEKGIEK